MKDSIEKLDYKGYTINIVQDTDPTSPDEHGDSEVFLVYDHRSFEVNRKGFEPREIFDHITETEKMNFEGYHVFVVYAYIHSGVSLSLGRTGYPFNDRWDVSSTGFVLVKKRKGWSYRRDKAEKIAEAMIEEWNNYLSGNVYGYIIEKNDKQMDSCFGYYGDYETSALIEAKSVVDHYIKHDIKSHLAKLKTWIQNRVPMVNRKALQISI